MGKVRTAEASSDRNAGSREVKGLSLSPWPLLPIPIPPNACLPCTSSSLAPCSLPLVPLLPAPLPPLSHTYFSHSSSSGPGHRTYSSAGLHLALQQWLQRWQLQPWPWVDIRSRTATTITGARAMIVGKQQCEVGQAGKEEGKRWQGAR